MVEFFDTLKYFIHLKKLDIQWISDYFTRDKINSVKLYLFKYLHQLEYLKFPLLEFVDCVEIQKTYSNVRFCWYMERDFSEVLNSYIFDRYEGNFGNQNSFEGLGEYRFSNGSRYKGEWKSDIKNGKGKYYYSDGSRYEGEWKGDKKNGDGIYYYSDGSKYEGTFTNGEREGFGIEFYSDGSKYEGEWKADQKDGIGKEFYSDGGRYEGEFKCGQKEGKGQEVYLCERYEGDFKNGIREGRGTKYTADGRGRYEGEWKNDMENGKGEKYYPDGRVEKGEWKNGELVESNNVSLLNELHNCITL
jgi:hypothetical protein